ncbi:MAG: nuclear transport factor 2 family protein [Gemmatimonadetes bacterium]|nr:nuclear transport factor 2 family protein [Gemmatimonadota bacterium]
MRVLPLLLALAGALPVSAQDLRPAMNRLVQAWQRGDADALSSFAAKSGVSLDLEGHRVGPYMPRQVTSALRRLFEQRETVSATIGMGKEVGGEPRRAFVEITWVTRPRGTTIPEETTVFFSLEREGESWRITEIRLIH